MQCRCGSNIFAPDTTIHDNTGRQNPLWLRRPYGALDAEHLAAQDAVKELMNCNLCRTLLKRRLIASDMKMGPKESKSCCSIFAT
jgi:hypothetical protein